MDSLLGRRGRRSQSRAIGVEGIQAQAVLGVVPLLGLLVLTGNHGCPFGESGPNIDGHLSADTACISDSA